MNNLIVKSQVVGCRILGWIFIGLLALAGTTQAEAGMLVESSSSHFGTYRGVDYVQHIGRFVGTTSSGEYRVPFEIVAPANPRQSNRKVVFEPPHFLLGLGGRDGALGRDLLFNRRFIHASVGFSNNGFNLLDPFVVDAVIAGQPVIANSPPILRDVEILKQFVEALASDPHASDVLGTIRKRYAYGVSQSAEALYEVFYGPGGAGLFDLTILHVPLWRPKFSPPEVLAVLPETFVPLPDIGKVMLISSEGDLLISQSFELRNAVSGPMANSNYRLYEVAGAPHLPDSGVVQGMDLNPLDLAPVVRAAFVAGHRWVSRGVRPPANKLIDSSIPGEIDPVYMMETGIARDINDNAAGGVRFPDVKNGRALHIASALEVEVIPGLAGLIGFWFDLACAPAAGSDSLKPRFASHRKYVRSVVRQSYRLLRRGYLLRKDARALIREARQSDVGKPGFCVAAP